MKGKQSSMVNDYINKQLLACTMYKNNCIRPTDILKYHVNNDRKIEKRKVFIC